MTLQLGLADDHFKAIQVQLTTIQRMLHTYNVSGQLISSVKRTFVESPNARKVMESEW